jgi:RNA polymerase II elongation factor ELL
MPPSPALSGIGSPSLASSGNTAQERVKQQRFPILHELAVQELSRSDLWARWDEGTEEDFTTALNKVADFDKDHQKWVLKRNCWKELDVFEYDYANEEDRQKAINNAIRQYDRLRISASDPLWQKLLPKTDRGKGICLSRLQAALAKGPSVSAAKQRADTASVSGGDSEKDDPTALKKGKGGEAMSRSSSHTSTGKKLSASEARAKRLLADPKKKKAVVEPTKKAAPKTSAPKSTTTAKAKPTKDARVLSKEIVSDSDSSDEEVSIAASTKPKAPAASASKPPQRVAERPRATEKTRESLPLKPKPAAMTKAPPREERREKEKDTIRAQVIAKPIKPRTKRSWEDDDDDSSSSGTPLSKRTKPVAKAPPAPTTSSAKARTASDASQNSRGGANSGAAVPKAKNTSPAKSSPLASSPPTNASEADQERRDRAALARIRERERERDRERERGRDTAVRSSSSSTDSSSVGAGMARKRPLPGTAADNHHHSNNRATKRLRPSQEAIEMATRFKHFYARYQQLHHDITSHDNPDPGKVTDLLDMHERLSRWKTEIYAAVEA